MVDDFHRNAAGFWFIKRTGGIAVECRPGFLVNLGLEGSLEGPVWIAGAQKVGMADEEALLVVVGVD